MYREFIFPYYRRIAEAYGMLSYGGDESVDAVWDEGVCDLPNLRKVSIAPQCDEYDMADRLRGTRIIYYRKLPPEALSDEDALRLSIRQTMTIARGCAIEFKPRCTPDMQGDFIRAQAYVDIIRASRQAGVHAHMLGYFYQGHGGMAFGSGQDHKAYPAAAIHGAGA